MSGFWAQGHVPLLPAQNLVVGATGLEPVTSAV